MFSSVSSKEKYYDMSIFKRKRFTSETVDQILIDLGFDSVVKLDNILSILNQIHIFSKRGDITENYFKFLKSLVPELEEREETVPELADEEEKGEVYDKIYSICVTILLDQISYDQNEDLKKKRNENPVFEEGISFLQSILPILMKIRKKGICNLERIERFIYLLLSTGCVNNDVYYIFRNLNYDNPVEQSRIQKCKTLSEWSDVAHEIKIKD